MILLFALTRSNGHLCSRLNHRENSDIVALNLHLDALCLVHGDYALHIVDLAEVMRVGVRLSVFFLFLSLDFLRIVL